MFECITTDSYNFFPVTHTLIPFYQYILWGGGWNGFFFAFSLASAFEFFEAIVLQLFDSYVFFGESETVREDPCGIVILDLGNAILGCLLGAIIINRHNTPIKSKIFSCTENEDIPRKERFCIRSTILGYIEITILFVSWSFIGSISWYCNTWLYSCTSKSIPEYFPYGHIFCTLIGILISWLYMEKPTAIKSIICTVVMCGIGSIKVMSSAIMVYISFALLSTAFIIYNCIKTQRPI